MQISDAEWAVMNVVWQQQPVEAAVVVSELSAIHGWTAATIKTMLHRLVKKTALRHEVNGKKYLYRSAVRKQDCVRRASRSFVDRVFGGEAGPALLHMVRTSKLSDDDLQQLQELLDSKSQTKPGKESGR